MRFFNGIIQGVREVNRKYATPSIRMTKGIKLALFTLRIYLLLLVGLLVFKFVVTFLAAR